MTTTPTSRNHSLTRKTGFTLIECLVYISVLAVVTGIGMMAFYRCWDDSKAIRRNADDIVCALHAGERWRADIRTASGAITTAEQNGNARLQIPTSGGTITYTFADGELRRQAGVANAGQVLLPKVKSSRMMANTRPGVTAWTWELELQPVSKQAKMRPLFTFEAVSGFPTKQ